MSEEDKKTQSFKVTDRRRIDEEGAERPVDTAAKVTSSESIATSQTATKQSALSSSEDVHVREDTAEVNFSSFIMSLATQALMQLGHIKPPPGVDLAIDREAARQTIDLIALLQTKTKGNLDSEEAHLIEEIVNSLRFQFVQKVTKGA
jgi:tellurite resistance protein